MNNKVITFLYNLSSSIMANALSLFISILIIIIAPKLIGVNEYGYLQLYLFYFSFIGFFQLGWNDGIYLRFGGETYSKLNKRYFFSQFWCLFIFQASIAAAIILFIVINNEAVDRQFIVVSIAICTIIVGSRAMLMFLLQATNRIREYSKIIIIDRVVYSILVTITLVLGITKYELFVISDLLAKLIAWGYTVYICKDLVFQNVRSFYISVREIKDNIYSGIKLMFSNISSILVVGTLRFGIERSWDISVFGKVSLTLSISNFFMVFINAVGIVIYPILRRVGPVKLQIIYTSMKILLVTFLFSLLLFYYPLSVILKKWLPLYAESIDYMSILFPIFVYEGKTALLSNTFFKTLRRENEMLKINIVTLLISVFLTILATQVLNDLYISILSIIILLAFRSILSDFVISKVFKIAILKPMLMESAVIVVFLLSSWYFQSWISSIIYCVAFLLYVLINKKSIVSSIKIVRSLVRR
ncbi:flippase [Paenibacillus oryzae]|uniref:Flippase n=1 Tax=Paenibacillus oryzae TaxID=1844972 RepID=A0A1A5YS18_9BACL|nr:hypothetical protein [Paenibacillus oryzae]OBR68421.1 flippase [Paenibacillus oryzae]